MSTALTEQPPNTKPPKNKEGSDKSSPFATAVVGETGISVKSGAEMWSLAVSIARSGLAPKGVETPEAILIALQMGFELGIPPMAALQNIAIINGRPSLWGDAVLAVVRSTGELEQFSEWYEQGGEVLPRNPVAYDDETVAVCRVKRSGCEPVEIGFSVGDARRASLWEKAGPWKQYPFRMLRMRARSFALRDAFGDALRGMLSAEEASDIPTFDALSVSPVNNEPPVSRSEALKGKLKSRPQAPPVPEAEPAQTPSPTAESPAAGAEPEPASTDAFSEKDLREMLSIATSPAALAELRSAVMAADIPRGVKVDLCNEISDRSDILEQEAAASE